jgi:hypothetical protein
MMAIVDSQTSHTPGEDLEIAMVRDGISGILTDSREVCMVEVKGTKTTSDGAKVTTDNVIGVTMDGLSKKD